MSPQKLKQALIKIKDTLHGWSQKLSWRPLRVILELFGSWWQMIAIALAALIFLYYPLGGWLVEDIDTDTGVEISPANESQSATAEMMSYLIRREVNDKIWTPNLPFFFPSYFLDNMPNFQLGLMSGVSSLSGSMAKKLEKNISSPEDNYLHQAAEFLEYPGTIWMFSPQSKLVPVPSAHSQYRKARKQLIKYNQALNDGSLVFYRNPKDLAYFLHRMKIQLGKTTRQLEAQIREESSSWFDNQADNLFYQARGLAYADYMLLKALGFDYKQILVDTNTYSDWTILLKTLESAAQLAPTIVRNGEADSLTAPNHLTNIGFYLYKAQIILQKISQQLEKHSPLKDSQW